jgi:pimeloyl-ACP methyl ester carboxylesterase
MTSEIKEQVVRVGSENVFCKTVIRDTKNKTLLLVHGASANGDSWLPVIPYFSEKLNIIALDLPGHYRSEGVPKKSIKEMATFINNFVQKAISDFSLQGDIVYVGHSLGGGIGIEIGVQQNIDWLKELVLVTTSANLNVLEPEFIEKLKLGEMDEGFFVKGFSPSTSPKLLEAILQRQGTTSVEASYYDFLAGSQFNRMDDLHQITARTLIITGKDDKIIPYEHQKMLHERIPNNTWVQIEKAGHFIILEHPEKVAQTIENFLL